MKNNLVLKRLCAYFIDIILISLISTAITYLSFINPKYEEYTNIQEEYNEVLNDYYDGKIEASELTEKANDFSYELNKTGYVYTISNIVVVFLYFGVFAYVTKGQTLGKKIMGIKIVSNKDKELSIWNYFIRVLILNGVLLSLTTLIAICFSKGVFLKIYSIASNLDTMLYLVIFIMILFRSDNRGLHDILAGTKVIDLKAKTIEESNELEEVKEEKEVSEINDEVAVIKPKKKRQKKETQE